MKDALEAGRVSGIRYDDCLSRQLAGASGTIETSLKNDMMFHMVMSKSKRALKGLICALKGLREEEVKTVKLLTPVDYNEVLSKHIVMDVRVELNNAEYLDIEVQIGNQKGWIPRSLLYLGRTFDHLQSGDDYDKTKPATHVGIMDFDLFPSHPEFYAKYLMINIRNGNVYSPDFALNVLSLKQIELATEEDHRNGLVQWAKLFLAGTWEELRHLSEGNPVFMEVTEKMAKANAELKQRVLLEMHERYLHDYATAKGALERAEKELRRQKRENRKQAKEIKLIAQDNEQKTLEIERLRAELAKLS
ncbi:MAG: Rpn family recombination-promoting nuclease/putative transposase [Lachnospiraceae bacterium]|nr:Rpn family recombination-promoting nuclease/putative transposase [Lachnospiraceae bacterium]